MALVEYSVKDRIGYITLNRPEKRNALSPVLVSDLKKLFHRAELDAEVKVIVLRANGDAFCAGADLQYLQQLQNFSLEENLSDSNHLKELFLQIYTLSKVVIAQVQGPALAGGCGLATVCDFIFSTPEAKFGYTEVKIGFVPAIVMIFLIRKIGEARSRDLLLSGRLVGAAEVQQWGLVNQVVDASGLAQTIDTFAQKLIVSASAQSLALTKKLIARVQDLPLTEALDLAARENANARASEDCKKGIAAFLNKEDQKW